MLTWGRKCGNLLCMWENMEAGEVAFVVGMGVGGAALLCFTVYASFKMFFSADYREMIEASNVHSSPFLGLLITGALCAIFFMPVVQIVKEAWLFHAYGIEGVATVERKVMENGETVRTELRLSPADGREEMLSHEGATGLGRSCRVGDRVPVLYLPEAPQRWILNERWARYLSPALRVELYLVVCCFAELMGMLCLVMYWPLPMWRNRG